MIDKYAQYIIFHLFFVFFSYYVFKKFKLLDYPNFKRKVHSLPVPYNGGIAIFFSYLYLIKVFQFDQRLENLLVYTSLILAAGLIDDRKHLHPALKLVLMTVPVLIIATQSIQLSSLGNYNYIGSVSLGKFDLIFTVLAVVLIINSFNYIDGIDGLGLSQGILSMLYLLYLSKNEELNNFIILLIIPLLVNIFFNFSSSKMIKFFLGDSGSMMIGMIIGFLAIYCAEYKNIHPSYIIWSLFFYVYEFFAVNIERIKNKKSLFDGSSDHIHHIVYFSCNKSHFKTTFIITLVNSIVIFCAHLVNTFLSNIASIILFIILFICFYFIRDNLLKKFNKKKSTNNF